MVKQVPTIVAEVTFLPSTEGGRQSPAFNSQMYRPHIVVGSQDQRVALTGTDGKGTEDYLGICFTGDGEPLIPGRKCNVELRLVYYPYDGYEELVTNATFTIREGARIVGFGTVSTGLDYGIT